MNYLVKHTDHTFFHDLAISKLSKDISMTQYLESLGGFKLTICIYKILFCVLNNN